MNLTASYIFNGALLRSLRIFTGLFLLGYVVTHLLNLSLGLVSLNTMDVARPYLSGLWSTPLTRPVLLFALIVHYGIGLWAIYTRPRIFGTTQDAVQVTSGLLVMPLLAIHAVGVIMLQNAQVDFDYRLANSIFWLQQPGVGLVQVLLLSVVWVHGCAGLFMWLRAKPRATRLLLWLYPLAVAIPVLALLGFVQAGRIVLIEQLHANVVQSLNADGTAPAPVPFDLIKQVTGWVIWSSVALSILVLVARALRQALTRPEFVSVTTKQTGSTLDVGHITVPTGQTLLDAFRSQDQPHANLCSGRGRCGTCAVRLLEVRTAFPAPSLLEQATLDRLNKGADVRLACQLPLTSAGHITVARLFPPEYHFPEKEQGAQTPRGSAQVETVS